jgi:2-methylcitrate dehydratase PrpD
VARALTLELAERAAALSAAPLPAAALSAASLSLLDAVGVSLAASTLADGVAPFAELVTDEAAAGSSTVLGTGVRTSAAAAAFANGAAAHALDFEDAVDGLAAHPNAQVIPVVLALAEHHDASGADVLAAIAIGCDITCRIAAVSGDRLAQRGWYPPPLAGAIGATFAGGLIAGLTPAQLVDAVTFTLSQISASGEIKNSPDSHMRAIRDAFACHAAVRGVELAARGLRGFAAPLEGKAGFFAAYAGLAADDAEALLDGFGETFWGTKVSFKPWPSCRGTHAFVDAALRLREHVDVGRIRSIELTGAPVNTMLAEPLATKRAPRLAIDAKFSLPYTVALALVDGDITLASFTPEQLRRPDLLAVAQKVSFAVDPARDRPEHMTSGLTTLRLDDGETVVLEIERPRGSAESPLDAAALTAKFIDNAAHSALTLAGPEELAADLLQLRHRPSVRDVINRHFASAAANASVKGSSLHAR